MIEVARPWMGHAEQAAAAQVIASGWVAQGPRVAEFERGLAATIGARGAVAVSSATAGLHLALVVAGVGSGDEVVVPSLSFIATANSVVAAGATPVFADVDEATQNITAATVAPVLTPATRAVTVVHQGGVPADVQSIRDLCEPLEIAVIEDAACAIGSTVYGDAVGRDSLLAVFSFHARKLLTTGEGGMVVTSDPALAQRLRALRDHGVDVDAYERHASGHIGLAHYREPAFNYRMTDIQGAIGTVQLGRLPELLRKRRRLAARYRERLSGMWDIRTAADPSYGRTNFQSFWVTLPDELPVDRDSILDGLLAHDISARPGFMAAHLEPAYAGDGSSRPVSLPTTEWLTRRTLILPLHHGLEDADIDEVVDVLAELVSRARTHQRRGALVT